MTEQERKEFVQKTKDNAFIRSLKERIEREDAIQWARGFENVPVPQKKEEQK